MAEEKKELTDAQKQILMNVITRSDSSTFVLCANDEESSDIEEFKKIVKETQGKHLTEEQKQIVKEVEDRVFSIYETKVFCAHCGKKAKVEKKDNSVEYSCDCDGSKEEKSRKSKIVEEINKLEKEFATAQTEASNKAIKIYKDNYKDIVEFRAQSLKKMDDEILGAAELV